MEVTVAQLIMEHSFDAARNRHYLNGQLAVLHCHHYAALFTQLAIDARDIVDGTRMLLESSEDVFFGMLGDYFKKQGVVDSAERIDLGRQLFSALGLGLMEVPSSGNRGGEVVLKHSHLDAGWLRKWGPSKSPVNFIGGGYLAALFSAAYDKPLRSYRAEETQSIACGADRSIFRIQG
jgi:hypothetical protein